MKVRWGKGTYGMMRYMGMVAPGHYQLKWQGDVVDIKKLGGARMASKWFVFVNSHPRYEAKTMEAAMYWVANVWGEEPVMTRNILNPAGGEFPIARKQKGGCCDPGTELYHCM
jgi:hypothetical protein